jgi:hypothetical protein
MHDTILIQALSNASSLELFELSTIIDRLLADPRRMAAVLGKLHPGKPVRFIDSRSGHLRSGKVAATEGKHVIVLDGASRAPLKVLYAAIDPGEASEPVESARPAAPAAPVYKPSAADFRRGDKVSFTDKYLQSQVGVINRINQKTASVDCGGGAVWLVPFAMLRPVMDI